MNNRDKPHNIDRILLEYYIKKAGMSTKEIAKAIGLSVSGYRTKITGARAFTVPEMFKLIEVLQIPNDGTIGQIFDPK